jgi:multiple sugar transport system ATP-binding protein
LENVTKIFDGRITAVDNVTLDIADREFMVVVGPSGCGKTTILRLIAGLEKPTSGSITLGQTIVNNIPPRDRNTAMVFQNYALYPHMTVFENMAFSLKLHKYPREHIRKRVEDVAALLGVRERLARKPKALSGGERQRVALGKAIVREPKAFLLDEPLSNLDTQLRITTAAELKTLHHKLETTTIYVTHDQAEAMMLGDRIAVMREGAIRQIGTPLEIYNRPTDRFVAAFFGTPSMNFIRGIIQYRDDTPFFVSDAVTLPAPHMKSILAAFRDKPVILGIRPEHISLRPVAGRTHNAIDCTIRLIEYLGNRMDLHLEIDSGEGLIATMNPAADVHVDRHLVIYFDIRQTHVFETDTAGNNISLVL